MPVSTSTTPLAFTLIPFWDPTPGSIEEAVIPRMLGFSGPIEKYSCPFHENCHNSARTECRKQSG